MEKQKRLRFSEDDNLALLRQVAGSNPFHNPAQWNVIQDNICAITGKTFSVRALRDHIELLIKLWLQKDKSNKAKSGIEEIYTEKDVLLEEIFNIMQEFKKKKGFTKSTAQQIGKENRDKWAKGLLEEMSSSENKDNIFDHNYCDNFGVHDETDMVQVEISAEEAREESILNTPQNGGYILQHGSGIRQSTQMKSLTPPKESQQTPRKTLVPTRAWQRRITTQRQGLNYLEKYDEKQFQLKQKELELEERRVVLAERQLMLEERKFDLSEYEEKKQLEILEKKVNLEVTERRQYYKLIEQQEHVIAILVNKVLHK